MENVHMLGSCKQIHIHLSIFVWFTAFRVGYVYATVPILIEEWKNWRNVCDYLVRLS